MAVRGKRKLIKEEWRTILGFPDYDVSNMGRVRSRKPLNGIYSVKDQARKPHPIKCTTHQDGYKQVVISDTSKKRSQLRVHRLVLLAFVGPCPRGMVTRHLDGNPVNNKLSNLKWGTHSENQQDSIRHGTHSMGRNITHHSGEDHGMSKLTWDDVVDIRKRYQRYRRGGMTQAALAKEYGVSRSTVAFIVRGETWK